MLMINENVDMKEWKGLGKDNCPVEMQGVKNME